MSASIQHEEVEWDELGFPVAFTSKRHRRRLRLRQFSSDSKWNALYPTLDAVLADVRAPILKEELRSMILVHGILPSYRATVYWTLAERHSPVADVTAQYTALLQRTAELSESELKQIELDLPRTFCEQRDFRTAAEEDMAANGGAAPDGSRTTMMERALSSVTAGTAYTPGAGNVHDALRRMLRAFCVQHAHIGYLQSQNFLAGFLLLIFGRDDEVRAYWAFQHLCAHMLAGYYEPSMAALMSDCALFSSMLRQRLPRLAEHMESVAGCDLSQLFLPRWLLCVFLNCFPIDIVLRVWDAVWISGTSAPRTLLEISLAVVATCEHDLMSTSNFADGADVLKNVGVHVTDSAELLVLTSTPACS
ncbi:TBC domain-containing protein, partial [archaeon]